VWNLDPLDFDFRVSNTQLVKMQRTDAQGNGPRAHTHDLWDLTNYLRNAPSVRPRGWEGSRPLTRGPEGELITQAERAAVFREAQRLGLKREVPMTDERWEATTDRRPPPMVDPDILDPTTRTGERVDPTVFPALWNWISEDGTAWANNWDQVTATPDTDRNQADGVVSSVYFNMPERRGYVDDGWHCLQLSFKSYVSQADLDSVVTGEDRLDRGPPGDPALWVFFWTLASCDDEGDWIDFVNNGPIANTASPTPVFAHHADTWRATNQLPSWFRGQLETIRGKLLVKVGPLLVDPPVPIQIARDLPA
jgi:hypothetical protein